MCIRDRPTSRIDLEATHSGTTGGAFSVEPRAVTRCRRLDELVAVFRWGLGDRSPIPAQRRPTTPQGAPREPGLFLPRRTHQGIPCHDIIKGTVSVAMTWQRRI